MPDLHLVRLSLCQFRLAQLGQRRHLPTAADDAGYLVHSFLGECFGEAAPAVFHLDRSRDRRQEVLAYSLHDATALRQAADLHADPLLHAGVDWHGLASKPMPTLPVGRRLELRVRLCPIVRQRRSGSRDQHDEVDAWLHAQCRALCGAGARPDPAFFTALEVARQAKDERLLDREQAYAAWAVALLERQAGVTVQRDGSVPCLAVEGRRLLRLVRRNRERQATLIPPRRRDDIGDEGKPEALVRATVSITDPAAFRQALARGVGRHRAFGFGMLLVRPAVG